MTIVMAQIMTCSSSVADAKTLMSLVIKRLKSHLFKQIINTNKL